METGKKGPSILFVCTANICRSPMAAALFRARLQKECPDWQDWLVDSAGTWAISGEPAAKPAQQVMARRGLDITRHRSKMVSTSMMANFDLVLTMEPGHKEALQVEFPAHAGRVFMLSEMEGLTEPVDDPYGGPVKAYEDTAEKLDRTLLKGMQRIRLLVAGEQKKQGAA